MKKYPSDIIKRVTNKSNLAIESRTNKEGKSLKDKFRLLDPWALAYFAEKNASGGTISTLTFKFKKITKTDRKYFEAFKRRISYLNITNERINFKIEVDNNAERLYSRKELFNRPDSEIVRTEFDKRKIEKTSKKVEKMLQRWLFNTELGNTNERLAIFGEDFFDIGKKGFNVEREFPTGVFENTISEQNRILPTNFIDLVTRNKHGALAIVEIKVNDSKLELISQALDYALFVGCYFQKLSDLLFKKVNYDMKTSRKKKFICYLVNNHFHPKFDDVAKFYKPNENMSFEFKKVVLGHTIEI